MGFSREWGRPGFRPWAEPHSDAYPLPLGPAPSPVYTSGTWAIRDHQRGQEDQGPCKYGFCRKEHEAGHGRLVLKADRKSPQTCSGWRIRPLGKGCGCGTPDFHVFPTIEPEMSGEGWLCAVPGLLRQRRGHPGAHCPWLAQGGACAPRGTPPSPPLAFLIRHGQEVALVVQVHQGPGQEVGDRVNWCF